MRLIEEEEEEARRIIFTVKVFPLRKAEFKAAAELRGVSMSSLIHNFMTDTIRTESRNDPAEFKRLVEKYMKEVEQEELKQQSRGRKTTRTAKSAPPSSKQKRRR